MSLYENPGVCPKCGTESNSIAPEPAPSYQYVRRCRCGHCGCTWSEIYTFERKRVDTECPNVKIVDSGTGRNFIYTVGEVFRHDGKTFRCSADSRGIVQYRLIDTPIDDMMYRAPNGKLYQYLCDPERYGTRVCACMVSDLRCDDIQRELFGRDCVKGEIWVPVDEGK